MTREPRIHSLDNPLQISLNDDKSNVCNEMDDLKNAQRNLAVDFKAPINDLWRSLQGKTILVTGGASGFGESIIKTFLDQPDTAAIIADQDDKKGKDSETSLCEAGCKVKYIQFDVTDWKSVISLFRGAFTWFRETCSPDRSIDHVVCSAGLPSEMVDLEPVQPEDFLNDDFATEPPSSRSISVSVIGSLYIVTAAMKFAMGLHKPGEKDDKSITLFASLAGYNGISQKPDYTASKWGVRSLFRSLLDDKQSASCPVRINLVAPYFVETPLLAHFVPSSREAGIKFAEIEDVRAAALRFIGYKSRHGRADGVWQDGPVDLCDGQAGGFASAALEEAVEPGALRFLSCQASKKRKMS